MLNIVAPALPDACLPLGMKSQDNKLKLVPIRPGKFILYFQQEEGGEGQYILLNVRKNRYCSSVQQIYFLIMIHKH